MSRTTHSDNLSVFDQIREGLEQSIAYARGEINLRTTVLPKPAPVLSKTRVASIRTKAGMSQAVFARVLNIPTKTLQSWEQGARVPKAGEARLLQLFEAGPEDLLALLQRAESKSRTQDGARRRAKPRAVRKAATSRRAG